MVRRSCLSTPSCTHRDLYGVALPHQGLPLLPAPTMAFGGIVGAGKDQPELEQGGPWGAGPSEGREQLSALPSGAEKVSRVL